jgi:hypothetical protein
MKLCIARLLPLGTFVFAVAAATVGIAQTPDVDPAGAAKVDALIAAVRSVTRFGAPAIAVVAAQSKTESTATSGLLNAIAQDMKDKVAAEGTDTAPSTIEPEVKKLVSATRELLALKDKALTPVVAAMADTKNADVQACLAKTEARVYMGLCIGAMRAYVNPNGGYSGTFNGMFASLDKYDREKIGDAFLEIFKNDKQTAALRALSGEGVAQFGSARHQAAVRALFANTAENEATRTRALYILARIGDRSEADKIFATYAKRMEETKKPDMAPMDVRRWAQGHFQCALLAQNIHDTDLAIKHYEAFLAAVEPIKDKLGQKEDHSGNYYNLACLYSLKGDVEGGLKALEKSFAEGYDNYKWANTDGDLVNLRKDDRFKALVTRFESGKGAAESAPAKQP